MQSLAKCVASRSGLALSHIMLPHVGLPWAVIASGDTAIHELTNGWSSKRGRMLTGCLLQ